MANRPALALVLILLSFRHVTAQPAPKYPTVEPLTHKSYTETIEHDGVKATFDMIAIPGGVFLMGSPATEKDRKDHEGPRAVEEDARLKGVRSKVTWWSD